MGNSTNKRGLFCTFSLINNSRWRRTVGKGFTSRFNNKLNNHLADYLIIKRIRLDDFSKIVLTFLKPYLKTLVVFC